MSYGSSPSYHINILPCIPDCDTTVTYDQMVSYFNEVASGVITVSGEVTYEGMVQYVNNSISSITVSGGITYQDVINYVDTHCTSSGTSYDAMVTYVQQYVHNSGAVTSINLVEFDFDYSTNYPRKVCPVNYGDLLLRCRVNITEPFDGPNPSFSIGDVDDNNKIFRPNYAHPTVVGSFETSPNVKYTSSGNINFYPNYATSTSGRGNILLEVGSTLSNVSIIDYINTMVGSITTNSGVSYDDMVRYVNSHTVVSGVPLQNARVTLTFPDTLVQSSFFPVITKTTVSGVVMTIDQD